MQAKDQADNHGGDSAKLKRFADQKIFRCRHGISNCIALVANCGGYVEEIGFGLRSGWSFGFFVGHFQGLFGHAGYEFLVHGTKDQFGEANDVDAGVDGF